MVGVYVRVYVGCLCRVFMFNINTFYTVWIFSMAPPNNFFPADPMLKILNAPGSYIQKEQIKPYPSQQGHQGHPIKDQVRKQVFWT